VFVPSLVVAVDRGPLARVVLLTGAALAAIVVGTRFSLQAPIIVGAGALLVLAVDAAVPVAAEIPRWIPIGVAGILLLWLGATFERRINGLRRLRTAFRQYG
jgi:hypothetical protein